VHDVRDLRETVREEIVERRESGHDVDGVAPSAEAIAAASDDELERYSTRSRRRRARRAGRTTSRPDCRRSRPRSRRLRPARA